MGNKLMCDPPSGWKYGFPREIPQEYQKEKFFDWLDMCGYPTELRESFGEHFYCRFWEENEE